MASDIEVGGGPVVSSHEPSYYEIALTNRQVMVAFVILLICILSAFFSGVWIGRESTARSADRLAQATLPAAEAPREGQAVEEFRFFKEGNGKAASEPAAAEDPVETETPKGSPLEEPPAPAPTRPGLFSEREPEVARPPAVPPVDTPRPLAPTPEKPAPLPSERAAERAAERPAPRETRPAEPAPAAGRLVIQVFSSPDEEQADKIRDRLVAAGQKAFLSPIKSAGRTMYRVRIGPFDSRESAEKAASRVRKDQRLDTWITPQ